MDNYKNVRPNVNQNYGYELARPYINRQVYTTIYNVETALQRGTLFPELDLVESNNYNDWLYENPENRVKGYKGCAG